MTAPATVQLPPLVVGEVGGTVGVVVATVEGVVGGSVVVGAGVVVVSPVVGAVVADEAVVGAVVAEVGAAVVADEAVVAAVVSGAVVEGSPPAAEVVGAEVSTEAAVAT